MGGSGGNYFDGKVDISDLEPKFDDQKSVAKKQELDSSVSSIIAGMLSGYDDRKEIVDTHLKNIADILKKQLDSDSLILKFGGSVAKHTYIDGLSDVDVLALIDKTDLSALSPDEVKNYFYTRLKENLPKTEIYKGVLAVTVHYKDIDIQILPAVKSGDNYKIPDSSGKDWSVIKPKIFAEILSKVNRDNGMKIVPTIKIAKSIITEMPEKLRLTGYHIEALAVEIFKNYSGPKTTKSMLMRFFNEAPKHISAPIKDKTGQSQFVDEYCGATGSKKREAISQAIARIGKAMTNADTAFSSSQWKEILNP
jgi:hypothetical protein